MAEEPVPIEELEQLDDAEDVAERLERAQEVRRSQPVDLYEPPPDPEAWREDYREHQRRGRQGLLLTPFGIAIGASGAGLYALESQIRACNLPDACDTPGLLGMGGVGLMVVGVGLVAVTPFVVGQESREAQRALVVGGAKVSGWRAEAAMRLTAAELVVGPFAWAPAMGMGVAQLYANRRAALELGGSAAELTGGGPGSDQGRIPSR